MVPVALSKTLLAPTFCLVLLAASAFAATAEETTPGATVDTFHDALRRGDEKAVMELLGQDAIILESGSAETRDEYERHHLKEDIEFAREVRSARSIINVVVEGNTAWIIATSQSKGLFHGQQINSRGTELIVLTKASRGWVIRAVHWSSHDATKTK